MVYFEEVAQAADHNMTLQFIEGFELSTSANCYSNKWQAFNNAGAFIAGRLHGTAAASGTPGTLTEWRTRSLGLQNTWTVGFGMQHPAATVVDDTDVYPLIVKRGTPAQIFFQWRKGTGNTFRFDIYRGATLLGSTSDFVSQSWHYFEFQFKLDPATGTIEFRHNTNVDFTAGPIDTADTGLAGADVFEISMMSSALRFDDIYILDDQGTINNDFLGDSVIEGRRPSGDGTPLDWSLDNGPGTFTNHWEGLDDTTCGTPQDFIFSSTIGHQDLLSFNALSFITGQVHGVMVNSSAVLDTTGSREYKHIARSGGTLYTGVGSSHTVASTSRQDFYDVLETDPDTGVKWTIAGVNAADFGVEVVS